LEEIVELKKKKLSSTIKSGVESSREFVSQVQIGVNMVQKDFYLSELSL